MHCGTLRSTQRRSACSHFIKQHHMKRTTIFFAALLLIACSDEKGDPVTIFTDVINNTTIYSNSIKEIKVEAHCYEGELNSFKVTSFDAERGSIILTDSTIKGQTLRTTYYYKAPTLNTDTIKVRLTFSATNNTGQTCNTNVLYRIINRASLLEETSGITLYTQGSYTKPDGLNLTTLRPILVELADSAEIDLYTCLDEHGGTAITREWRTNTNILFARSNSFNYAEATDKTVSDAYASSLGMSRIGELVDNDIVLFGRMNKALGVIKIIYVFDEPGTDNDRYLINVKKIKE